MHKGFWFLFVFVTLAVSSNVFAQTDTALEDNEEIAKATNNVMNFSGGEMVKRGIKFLSQSLAGQKVPQEIINEVTVKIDVKQFDQVAVEVFKKHFTVEDAKAINEFYQSPVGKKLKGILPVMGIENVAEFSELMQKVNMQVFDELQEKGYSLEDLRKNYLRPAVVPGGMPTQPVSVADDKKQ